MSANSLAKKMAKTNQQEIDMKEMKRCQLQAGWYGLLATVLGGAVAFAGLKLAPSNMVPKNYVPMLSIGCAAVSGWFVSINVTKNCRLEEKLAERRTSSATDGRATETATSAANITLSSSVESPEDSNTKFGDKGFYQEENR